MPRTTNSARDLKRVLEFMLNRDVLDAEIAAALDRPASTFARRKHQDNFPTYEELALIGDRFDISARALQIAFGLRGEDEIAILTPAEREQYDWIVGPPVVGRGRRQRRAARADVPNL